MARDPQTPVAVRLLGVRIAPTALAQGVARQEKRRIIKTEAESIAKDVLGSDEGLSLSVFFPAYNDAESLPELLERTFDVVPQLTSDYEVIVIDDGSRDNTASILERLCAVYAPHLKSITHETNLGYGAALKSGFAACEKEVIFYTDGDGQYDVGELQRLWEKMRPDVDLVNGYKVNRGDGMPRKLAGYAYKRFVRSLFGITIRDVDCDFRLIRRSLLSRIQLHSDSGFICVELIKRLQDANCRFEEVGVRHYPRMHGQSQVFRLRPLFRTLYQLIEFYISFRSIPTRTDEANRLE